MSERKVPKLRFAGFTDDWKQRKLGELLILLKDGTHGTHKDVKNDVYLLSAKNIKNGKIIFDESDRTISDEEYQSIHKNFSLLKNDILLTIVGTIGETAIIENPNKITFQRSVAYLRVRNELLPQFLYSVIQANRFQEELKNRQVISAQAGIYLGSLAEIEISFPTLAEQQAIGEFFRQLDDTIAFHQREWEKYKNLKISYLEKMFPQENENKPQLRFPNFTDAWKQRKLGELMDITSVKRVHQSDWTSSGVRFLRARDIVAFAKNEIVEDPLYISIQQYNEYSKLSGVVNIGDVLVTGVGTIGVPMLIDDEKPVYFKDGNIIWFKNNNKIDGRFLYYAFTAPYIQRFISNVAGIGTVGTYTIENGKKTPILLPTLPEQQAIGEFFKQLDDTIAFHQRELEKYKNLKNGYLKQMFV